MVAEALAVHGAAGARQFDAMPSVGRKFPAGRQGRLNLTHDEVASRSSAVMATASAVGALLDGFCCGAAALLTGAAGLGIITFVGSSAVFPRARGSAAARLAATGCAGRA